MGSSRSSRRSTLLISLFEYIGVTLWKLLDQMNIVRFINELASCFKIISHLQPTPKPRRKKSAPAIVSATVLRVFAV